MRTYEVINDAEDGLIRIRTKDSGHVLAAVTADEARSLWINLGEGLGLGTAALTTRHVERASSLKDLAKRLKKTGPRGKKS
jgi:hypothetical protein